MLTIDDITKGIEQIKNKTYSPKNTNENISDVDDSTIPPENSPSSSSGSSGASSSSSGTGSTSGSNKPARGDNSGAQDTTTPEVDYSKMSLDDLKSEKTSQQSNVQKASQNVNDVLSGSNSIVKAAEDDAKSKKLLYDNAVEKDEKISDDLKKRRTENLDSISKQEAVIDDLKIDLNNKESEISQKSSQINSLTSNVGALESSFSTLSTQTSEEPEIQTKIDSQKELVSSQLETAKSELETAKKDLETLNKQKAEIESKIPPEEEALKGLETEKAEIESEILANCGEETKQAMSDYNTAKANAESVKNTELNAAKDNLKTQETLLAKIETELNTKNSEKIQKDNRVKTTTDVFDPDVELDMQYIEMDGELPYLLIGPKDVDPNAELPMILYLHGSGEFGAGKDVLQQVGPGMILQNWGFENFNGYIVCPLASKKSGLKNWENPQAVEYIDSLLTNFKSTHNVDSSRISIAGHSLGGKGTEYLSVNMPGTFYRAAVLSGFYSDARMDETGMEVRGYVGSGDSKGSVDYMHNGFVNEVGKENMYVVKGGHGRVPAAAFALDENNNGRADILEFLFGEDE